MSVSSGPRPLLAIFVGRAGRTTATVGIDQLAKLRSNVNDAKTTIEQIRTVTKPTSLPTQERRTQ